MLAQGWAWNLRHSLGFGPWSFVRIETPCENPSMLKTKTPTIPTADGVARLLDHYGCGPIRFSGTDDALYERRLLFDHVVDPDEAGPRDKFEAVATAIRDVLAQQWLKTLRHHDRANPKQVYYLSMEFLIGRSLS